MKILSEDNRYMTTSILMAKYFNIEYMGGNSGLRKYTKNKDSKNLSGYYNTYYKGAKRVA